jgi:hypothetical protein
MSELRRRLSAPKLRQNSDEGERNAPCSAQNERGNKITEAGPESGPAFLQIFQTLIFMVGLPGLEPGTRPL